MSVTFTHNNFRLREPSRPLGEMVDAGPLSKSQAYWLNLNKRSERLIQIELLSAFSVALCRW
jgi:hypothetical protein